MLRYVCLCRCCGRSIGTWLMVNRASFSLHSHTAESGPDGMHAASRRLDHGRRVCDGSDAAAPCPTPRHNLIGSSPSFKTCFCRAISGWQSQLQAEWLSPRAEPWLGLEQDLTLASILLPEEDGSPNRASATASGFGIGVNTQGFHPQKKSNWAKNRITSLLHTPGRRRDDKHNAR